MCAHVHVTVRVRACVYAGASVRACARACVSTRVLVCVRACAHLCAFACVLTLARVRRWEAGNRTGIGRRSRWRPRAAGHERVQLKLKSRPRAYRGGLGGLRCELDGDACCLAGKRWRQRTAIALPTECGERSIAVRDDDDSLGCDGLQLCEHNRDRRRRLDGPLARHVSKVASRPVAQHQRPRVEGDVLTPRATCTIATPQDRVDSQWRWLAFDVRAPP